MTRELALLIYLVAWGGIAWSLSVLVLLAKRELQVAWRRRQVAKVMQETKAHAGTWAREGE